MSECVSTSQCIKWTLEPSKTLGPGFEVLKVECSIHPWSYASHEHGIAADAARDHELFHHRWAICAERVMPNGHVWHEPLIYFPTWASARVIFDQVGGEAKGFWMQPA